MMIRVIWDFRIGLKWCSLGLELCILAWAKLYCLDGAGKLLFFIEMI